MKKIMEELEGLRNNKQWFFHLASYINLAIASLFFCGCDKIGCKKEADYTLTDYAKSWFSSYQSQTVIFKNQFDSLATYVYSTPQPYTYNIERSEGGCVGSTYATIQVSDMKLESSDLPYYFSFELHPFSTSYHGNIFNESFWLAGNAEINYIGAFATGVIIDLQNQGADLARGTYHDSVSLNSRIFYQAYSDTNFNYTSFPDSVLSIYFTKQDGVVGFRTRTETWSLN